MHFLTEWEGRAGKYLARGPGIRKERSEVRASCLRAKYFPFQPDLTQSISILPYHIFISSIIGTCPKKACKYSMTVKVHARTK